MPFKTINQIKTIFLNSNFTKDQSRLTGFELQQIELKERLRHRENIYQINPITQKEVARSFQMGLKNCH